MKLDEIWWFAQKQADFKITISNVQNEIHYFNLNKYLIFRKKKSSEHVLKPRPSSTMFNHQLLNSCKFFQLSKVLVTQASVLTFKYQCDVVYSTFKKPKSGIWLLELFSRFWEGLFKAYFINSRSIIYRLNGEIRFQFIKVKNLFLFISKKWHVDRWLMYGKSKKYLN